MRRSRGFAMNSLIRLKAAIAGLGWITGTMYALAVALRRFCPFFSIEKYYVVAQPITERKLLPEKRGKDIVVLQIDRAHALISQLPRPRDEK